MDITLFHCARDAVADGFADAFAALPRHEPRRRARGDARGSSITILLPASHASSSSAGGTCVVLPAPGGASSTSRGCIASEARIRGSSSSIGKELWVTRARIRARAAVVPDARLHARSPAHYSASRLSLRFTAHATDRHRRQSLARQLRPRPRRRAAARARCRRGATGGHRRFAASIRPRRWHWRRRIRDSCSPPPACIRTMPANTPTNAMPKCAHCTRMRKWSRSANAGWITSATSRRDRRSGARSSGSCRSRRPAVDDTASRCSCTSATRMRTSWRS